MFLIASMSELFDVEQVQRLTERSDILVLQDNQPQFAILSMERYRELTNAAIPSDATIAAASPAFSQTSATSGPSAPTEPEKIGPFVRRVFSDYCARNLLPEDEIERLCDLEYSRNTFFISYPVLKAYNPAEPLAKQAKDERGYNRYYATEKVDYPLSFYGKKYLLCNNWTENYRWKFERWAQRWE